jgi:hypothetical protein
MHLRRTGSSPSGARHRSDRRRGQSLVEFAITAPIVLLMVLFGIDFGRVYLGWVTLNNAVREAANFAAINPNGWSPPNAGVVNEYERLITTESAQINCTLPGSLPPPAFPSGRTIGSPAVVSITCEFTLITPLIGNFLGNPLDVSASAAFPIRSGSIAGTPGGGGGPLPSIGPVLPTPSPIPTPSPLVPPVDPTPTPEPMCTVPNLVQGSLKTDAAVAVWTASGFLANSLAFQPLVPPHFDIKDQSLTAGSSVLCSSSMTAYDKKQ